MPRDQQLGNFPGIAPRIWLPYSPPKKHLVPAQMEQNILQENILQVLRASPVPLRALDIARKIGPSVDKKTVNQVLYKMKGVEISNPGQNPPLWKISTPSSAQQEVPGILSSPPVSPPSAQGGVASGETLFKRRDFLDGGVEFTPVKNQTRSATIPKHHTTLTQPIAPVQESGSNVGESGVVAAEELGSNTDATQESGSNLGISHDELVTQESRLARETNQEIGSNVGAVAKIVNEEDKGSPKMQLHNRDSGHKEFEDKESPKAQQDVLDTVVNNLDTPPPNLSSSAKKKKGAMKLAATFNNTPPPPQHDVAKLSERIHSLSVDKKDDFEKNV